MKKSEYTKMAERESSYWWHVGRLKIIQGYLEKIYTGKELRILNVGCGTGGTLPLLEKYGKVDNVDVSEDAIAFMKTKGYKVTKVTGISLPFRPKTYDLVVAFDVLEHIDKDNEALAEWKRVLKDDGKVLLTVPAYQWLWSAHDTSLHHKRRYTVKEVDSKAQVAQLRPFKTSYAIVFSLPLIVGFRFLNKVLGRKTDSETSYVNVPKWVNTVFTQLLFIEAKMHKYIRFPFGTSVIARLDKSS